MIHFSATLSEGRRRLHGGLSMNEQDFSKMNREEAKASLAGFLQLANEDLPGLVHECSQSGVQLNLASLHQ